MNLERSNDTQFGRGVVKFSKDGETYRCVAELKKRYVIEGVLSVGGFGVIYQARDKRLYDKKVLIKANRYPERHLRVPNNKAVIHEAQKQRSRLAHERKMLLQAEKRGISQVPLLLDEVHDLGLDLYGPHVADDGLIHYQTIQDLWQVEPFLVLSYIEGKTLDGFIKTEIFSKKRLHYAKQLIFGIGSILQSFHNEVANEKGIPLSFVYQDLKPANIIFTAEKQFVLIDFGGFAVRVKGKTLPDFTRTGTPGYQPPEFLPNTNFPTEEIDARADVFSLGATIYHLATGAAPLSTPDGESLFEADKLGALDKSWQEWIARATQKLPQERFENMEVAKLAASKLPTYSGNGK